MAKPLREPTFWILTALATRPLYGYGVIQEVTALSDGKLTLQAGTLYAALDRLAAEGLVEPDHEEVIDGRTRRYYRLSHDGVAALQSETARLQHSVQTATRQLTERRFSLGPAAVQVSPGLAMTRTGVTA
jgi:DNA-binding PadR family transcriptional regulator